MTRMKMLGAGLLILSLTACSGNNDSDKNAPTTGSAIESASGVAEALAGHKAFAALVEQADLATAIDGPGAYTVFAPGDAALAALPKAIDGDASAERQRATTLVLAHVAPGVMTLADLRKAVEGPAGQASVRTMAGDMLTITQKDGKLMIGREGVSPVPLDAAEIRASDDMVIGVGGTLVDG